MPGSKIGRRIVFSDDAIWQSCDIPNPKQVLRESLIARQRHPIYGDSQPSWISRRTLTVAVDVPHISQILQLVRQCGPPAHREQNTDL